MENMLNFIKLNKSDIKKFEFIKTGINNNYLQFHKIFFLIIILFFLLGLILNKKNEKRQYKYKLFGRFKGRKKIKFLFLIY